MSDPHPIPVEAASAQDEIRPAREPARLASLLLAVAGLSLVAVGSVLWARHGDSVFVGNPILAALAWCF